MSISNNKIPFGLKNGILVDVSEVKSGLACGCVCPSCHRKLQANKGKIVAHYFSHNPSEDTDVCESAFETAIHLMAKQIISEEGYLLFPELSVKETQADANGDIHKETSLVEKESIKRFDMVELEKHLDDIRPDIIAYQGSIYFLIEIAVTNFSNNEKITRIRNKSMPAIEIDLSNVSYSITKEELKQLIVEKSDNKKWLSNPAAIPIKQQLKVKLDEKIRVINENIYRARKKAIIPYRAKLAVPQKRYLAPLPSKSIKKNERDSRWFACESCKNVFNVPLQDAPYTIDTLQCPKCSRAVSTRCLSRF